MNVDPQAVITAYEVLRDEGTNCIPLLQALEERGTCPLTLDEGNYLLFLWAMDAGRGKVDNGREMAMLFEFCRKRIDINVPNPAGWTALHFAAGALNKFSFDILQRSGALQTKTFDEVAYEIKVLRDSSLFLNTRTRGLRDIFPKGMTPDDIVRKCGGNQGFLSASVDANYSYYGFMAQVQQEHREGRGLFKPKCASDGLIYGELRRTEKGVVQIIGFPTYDEFEGSN